MELTKKYDAAAIDWRERLEKMRFPAAYRHLCASLPSMANASVADIGCGTGALSKAYCDTQGRPRTLTLVDPSMQMLDAARAHLAGHATDIRQRVTTLDGLEPYTLFDATLCAHVIEHCADPKTAMHHLARVTKPGGYIALAVSKPHVCQLLIWLRWQHRWFSQKQVIQMGRGAGLDLLETITFPNGVPARVSQGFIFQKPNKGNSVCSYQSLTSMSRQKTGRRLWKHSCLAKAR